MTGRSSCPDPEVLAAFVAGSLRGSELQMVAEHLQSCEDCLAIVAEAAIVGRDEAARRAAKPADPVQELPFAVAARTSRRWWLVAAAAALAGVVVLSFAVFAPRGNARSLRLLIDASPHDERSVEPRLSGGFAWAPLRHVRRSTDEPLDASEMQLIGAAGIVLNRTKHDDSSEAQHVAALAHLLAGRPNDAVSLMNAVAPSMKTARVWSDLAAAEYTAAVSLDQPALFAQALAAADAALRIDPAFAEARFNRALVLERLGLRDEARAAWERYLIVDSQSPWAQEARQHLARLKPVSDFGVELDRKYAKLDEDPGLVHDLADRFPQEIRVWGETEILARWATAHMAHDDHAAAVHLSVARAFGREIAQRRDERMLASTVEAIDRSDEEHRAILAESHLLFRDAQQTFHSGRPGDAERLFARAAEGFKRGDSPLVLVARYFEANTIFAEGRVSESRQRLEQLDKTAPEHFPAHRAQVEWELGLAYASLGQWGDAIRTLAISAAAFERLHELKYATAVHEILAESYDRIGDRRRGWEHRLIALRELGRTESPRLQIAVESAAHAAALQADWPVSLSFLGLVLDMAPHTHSEERSIETRLLRARVEGRLGRKQAATNDAAIAEAAISRLRDVHIREHAEAEYLAVAAVLTEMPRDAVVQLTQAIAFHASKGRRMLLPEMFLQRGRAFEALGRQRDAAGDFEAGIQEVEAERRSITESAERWGMFARADELFEEAMSLALQHGDVRLAFDYCERARGREVVESMGADWLAPVPAAATDALIVEYASLPERLVVFVRDGGHVRAIQTRVARTSLATEVERMRRGAMEHDDVQFRQAALVLHHQLLAPLAEDLRSSRLLAFVPDATLSGIPFAGLLAPTGEYLIEDHPIVVSPSAAVFLQLIVRAPVASSRPRLLLVAGPAVARANSNQLSAEQREVDAVAAVYGDDADLMLHGGDLAEFSARGENADVIHFVGHAVVPSSEVAPALVISRSQSPGGELGVRDIAALRLSRTRAVVLAACATALEPMPTTAGNISVARAFVAAGVPSVVATLWPIDDEAASEFFPRVHRQLAKGIAPAQSIRAAQIAAIRDGTVPAMWAAVQVIGS